jgi:hypothetical protein
MHLTLAERTTLAAEIADCVSGWGYARLFAECIDKLHFDPIRTGRSVDEQAFEQIVSRFEQYIVGTDEQGQDKRYGVLVHDNNQTVAKKHTELMRSFHRGVTLWTKIDRLIETRLRCSWIASSLAWCRLLTFVRTRSGDTWRITKPACSPQSSLGHTEFRTKL